MGRPHGTNEGPDNVHATHQAVIKRLRRAAGHLNSTIEMIEAQRPCLELAQQLHAVESAITQAKKTLIHDHIDHCLDESVRGTGAKSQNSIEEFKEITKYL
jgi:DNA-binding FrmR family transcriptional regulator